MVPSRSGLIALALLGSALGFAPRASPARHRCARPAASTTAEDDWGVETNQIMMGEDSELNFRNCTHIEGGNLQQGKSRVTKKYVTSNLVVASQIFEYKMYVPAIFVS